MGLELTLEIERIGFYKLTSNFNFQQWGSHNVLDPTHVLEPKLSTNPQRCGSVEH